MSSSLLPLLSSFTSNTEFISRQPITTRTNQTHGFKVSCNIDNNNDNNLILPETKKLIPPNVDRRNLLVGLGELYITANLASIPAAFAAPITSPDITSICKESSMGIRDLENAVRTRKCCPPSLGKKIKSFEFPSQREPTRMRWPAHKGSDEQMAKYRAAIQAMRELPSDHPHSFDSQAKIHCAYCNGGYTQVENGFPEIDIQIHNSWLFFPYHRWYLYFYERILGKLINDPTFALPYWNWDDPRGMATPEMFVPKDFNGKPNPLYDVYRDSRHIPELVDLAFAGTERDTSDEIQIACNLSTVYRDLVRNGGDTLSFFGGEYSAGDAPVANGAKSIGSVEAGTHVAVHRWVGDANQPNFEDMGNLYSSGFDPLFYVHHANVDRMWKIWKDLKIRGHNEPKDPDWLNASYVFYDENQDLVRVKNKDSINIEKLNFDYEGPKDVFPWRKSRPGKRTKGQRSKPISLGQLKPVEEVKFPVKLNEILKVRVKRPAVNRTDEEKEQVNEVLLINGIRFNSDKFVKFDVFVNDNVEDGTITTPCDPEYAGGFTQIPHNDMKKMFMTSAARFGLTELLEDTKTEDQEYAVVTLVPKTEGTDLTVGEIKIVLVPLDD